MGKVKNTLVSMTGFGSGRASNQFVSLNAEIKTLNGRFLDIILRMPRCYAALEGDIRSLVGKYLDRGRCEISVDRQPLTKEASAVRLNQPLFTSYYETFLQAAKQVEADTVDFRSRAVFEALNRRDVLEASEEIGDQGSEGQLLVEAIEAALKGVLEMRMAEGVQLGLDLSKRLENLRSLRRQIATLLQDTPQELQKRFNDRLAALVPDVRLDPERLAIEVAIMADRVDITEELVRLESHFDLFGEALNTSGTGRKLEFLLQEVGRELNTIGSKAQNAAAQQLVVDAKAEMEKIREQLQNVA